MVSVVIPSYNSESTIANCLDALLNQTYQDQYEIILVDSSQDHTAEIVQTRYSQIKFIHLDIKTDPGTARNIGVKESRGDPILFTDSDCIVSRQWIEKMVLTHSQHSEYIAVGGSVENGNNPQNNVAWAGYLAEFREHIPQQPGGLIWHNPTCNISYKKDAFLKHGFFDSRLYPQEDLVYNYNLAKKGEKILFAPDISIQHTHREKMTPFLVHQTKVGVITSRVLKIISLPGSVIAGNKLLFLLTGWLLPIVKLFKTTYIFAVKNPRVLYKHPLSVVFLSIGLIYWYFGFFKGVFSEPILKVKN
jgi:glycosyltransferase involved in cell wall biosynthesis